MDIKITTEWIFDKLLHTYTSDGNGNALVICDDQNYHWIKLAFDSININYDEDEYFDDDFTYFEYFFMFSLGTIKDCSPKLYKSLLEIDTTNRNRPIATEDYKYVYTGKRVLTFEECESHLDKISNRNLGLLASHVCVEETAQYIEGFVEQNGILLLNIDGEMTAIYKKGDENDTEDKLK